MAEASIGELKYGGSCPVCSEKLIQSNCDGTNSGDEQFHACIWCGFAWGTHTHILGSNRVMVPSWIASEKLWKEILIGWGEHSRFGIQRWIDRIPESQHGVGKPLVQGYGDRPKDVIAACCLPNYTLPDYLYVETVERRKKNAFGPFDDKGISFGVQVVNDPVAFTKAFGGKL